VTYFAIQALGVLVVALVLGSLGYYLLCSIRRKRRATRQLHWSREMRRTFEDEA